MAKLDINVRTAALLVMDCQVDIMNYLTPLEKEKILGNLTEVQQAGERLIISVEALHKKLVEGWALPSPPRGSPQ